MRLGQGLLWMWDGRPCHVKQQYGEERKGGCKERKGRRKEKTMIHYVTKDLQ